MGDASGVDPNYAGEHRTHDPAVELAARAKRQHGVIARRQIAELGLGRHYIDRQVQRGRLHVLHRGVYAVGHRALTRHGRWMAAVLAAGDGAVLRRRSAAALWRIIEREPARIEIAARGEHRRGGVIAERTVVPPDERDEREGIPVTTPARTLLDLAVVLDEHRLARACERAESLRLGSPTTLEALLDRYPRRPGTPKLKRLIEENRIVATTTANELERDLLTLLDANDLPRPLVNEHIDPATKPDFRWPDQRLIVELDGFETHGTRAAFERDRERDRKLTAQGWRVVRITRRQLQTTPRQIADELRAMLRSATTAAPAPPRGPRTRVRRSRPAGR